MKRDIDLQEITDGKVYGLNDMVKADCQDCVGCSACCRGMGDSIVLDPLDVWRLTAVTGRDVQGLLNGYLVLGVVDGIVLPSLNMQGEGETCPFLSAQGRCQIHSFRPGICRLFPLGRLYENGGVSYFLQIHECTRTARAKVKVKKWLEMGDGRAYEAFVTAWHYFLTDLEEAMAQSQQEEFSKKCSMYVLSEFYMKPYESGLLQQIVRETGTMSNLDPKLLSQAYQGFYQGFYQRLQEVRHELLGE